MTLFHLAIPVDDLARARAFYCDILGCGTGREDERWLDLDFFDHQLTLHLVETMPEYAAANEVDGAVVPAGHFGAILPLPDWQRLRDRLAAHNTQFVIGPTLRFAGETGEQHTMFFRDPSGNALEFKSFSNPEQVFASAPAVC